MMPETEDANNGRGLIRTDHGGTITVEEIYEQGIFELNNGKDLVMLREFQSSRNRGF